MYETTEKSRLNVYIDESGSITKTKVSQNQYFVIAILFTRNPQKIKRQFRKGISALIKKNPKYKKILEEKGEIKGSEVSEHRKKEIYRRIIRNCADEFELGIIVLDNRYTLDSFIQNHARTFNYILQLYFENVYRKQSRYAGGTDVMSIVIDEQNIATDTRYTLNEYLEQHFTVYRPLCDHFDVRYVDSKNHLLIQLIDFVANTFYRNLEKHDEISVQTVNMLREHVCGKDIFVFPNKHDTTLYLHT